MESNFDTTTPQGMEDVLNAIGEATEEPTEELHEEGHEEEAHEDEAVEEIEEEGESEEESGEDDEDIDDSEEVEEEEVEEADEVAITPEDFAELLGVDSDQVTVDEDGNAQFVTKVDGERTNVKMADLVKSYQLDSVITRKSQALSNDRKEFDTQREEYLSTASQRLNETSQLTQYMENALLNDFNGVDWNTLKAQDPQGYMVRRQDYNDKQVQLDQVKQALTAQGQALHEEQQKENAAKESVYIEEQATALLDAIPAWNDPEVAKREHTAINDFAKERYGFTDDELGSISEARAIRVLRDAMRYRQGKSDVDLATKKIKKLPKKAILRPKGNKKRINPTKQKVKTRRLKFNQSGSKDDALALLNAMD